MWVSGNGGFVTDVGMGQVVQWRQRRCGFLVLILDFDMDFAMDFHFGLILLSGGGWCD